MHSMIMLAFIYGHSGHSHHASTAATITWLRNSHHYTPPSPHPPPSPPSSPPLPPTPPFPPIPPSSPPSPPAPPPEFLGRHFLYVAFIEYWWLTLIFTCVFYEFYQFLLGFFVCIDPPPYPRPVICV
ncbi:hypothetical protein EXVG_00157 [Emiliania huxleyi virus 202]|nr:hypothetical protein EXVG_00157 [Emiliania huxleyi virus 202]